MGVSIVFLLFNALTHADSSSVNSSGMFSLTLTPVNRFFRTTCYSRASRLRDMADLTMLMTEKTSEEPRMYWLHRKGGGLTEGSRFCAGGSW